MGIYLLKIHAISLFSENIVSVPITEVLSSELILRSAFVVFETLSIHVSYDCYSFSILPC